jgi:hypothetical protein
MLPKPFQSGSKFYRDEEDQAARAKYRTECWLEQCMFDERLCSPDEQVTFLPLVVQTPVPGKCPYSKRSIKALGIDIDEGAENVVLAISGFSQSEKYGLKRLFRALGKIPYLPSTINSPSDYDFSRHHPRTRLHAAIDTPSLPFRYWSEVRQSP